MNNQQTDVLDAVINDLKTGTKGSYTVNANPGTGKTYLTVEVAKAAASLGYKVGIFPFGRDATAEVSERLGKNPLITVSTSHSEGKRWLGRVRVDDNDNFLQLYLKGQGVYNQNVLKLINLCKANLVTDETELMTVVNRHKLEFKDATIYGIVLNALQINDPKWVTFEDMIRLPVIKNKLKPIYDLVILDEYQDQSYAQVQMALRLTKGVLLCVGQDLQAIYGFRGGLFQVIPGTITKTLNLTYRFGVTIAAYINGLFDTDIVPAIDKAGAVTFDQIDLGQVDDSHMIIARTNAELIPHAVKLLTLDKKINLTNRDLLQDMIRLLYNAHSETCPHCGGELITRRNKKPYGDPYYLACGNWPDCKGTIVYNYDYLVAGEALIKIKAVLAERRLNQDVDGQAVTDDTLQIFEYLLNTFDVKTAISKLNQLTQATSGAILTTAHKSKGLQANTVHVLQNGFEACKTRAIKNNDAYQAEQEHNLWFVTLTRAISQLNIVPKS